MTRVTTFITKNFRREPYNYLNRTRNGWSAVCFRLRTLDCSLIRWCPKAQFWRSVEAVPGEGWSVLCTAIAVLYEDATLHFRVWHPSHVSYTRRVDVTWLIFAFGFLGALKHRLDDTWERKCSLYQLGMLVDKDLWSNTKFNIGISLQDCMHCRLVSYQSILIR